MFSVAREFSFSYGHRLYRYEGKCRRLHGHNARVRVEILGDENGAKLDDQGMAFDFARMKSTLGRWLEEELDHRVFLSADDPLADLLDAANDPPIRVDGAPTAETLAKLIFDRARADGLNVVRVDFWETEKCRATYRA